MEPTELTGYTPEQQRVSDYIQEITNGAIGSGEDPIGFLIASHSSLRAMLDKRIEEERKTWVPPTP